MVRKRISQRGFTLLEVMVALALSALLLTGAMTMLSANQHTSAALTARARAQENLQLAFALIEAASLRAGRLGCNHPQRPILRFLRGAWTRIPEYDITRPVTGYDALGNAAFTPNPALTLPLSGDAGDLRVHHQGHGIDLQRVAASADILVMRGTSAAAPLAAKNSGAETIAVAGHWVDFAPEDVILLSDCEQAALVKVTHARKTQSGWELGWAEGTGDFANAKVGVAAVGRSSERLALLPRGFGADASVATVSSTFFYLGPSLVHNRQGRVASSLWRKSGAAEAVEMIAGIDDMQVWYLVSDDLKADSRRGYFKAGQWPLEGHVIGIRVQLRSSSVDGLAEAGLMPVSITAVRTFMLPRFARWGHSP